MMHKHLRRWHFDLALFLGLAIFSCAYWYSKPRPLWTTFYPTENQHTNSTFTLLGYSADSQSIYTTCGSKKLSKNFLIPQIQRWSAQTGELLEDYTVEMPEEDRFLLQLLKADLLLPYNVKLCDDPRYILVRYQASKKKGEDYLRLYRIDGKAIGYGVEVPRGTIAEYLTDPSHTNSNRHWLVSVESYTRKPDVQVSVFDLETGKTVRPPQAYPVGKLNAFEKIVGGWHLVFFIAPTETKPMEIEFIDLLSGESQGRLQSNHFPQVFSLDDTHFAVVSMIGKVPDYTAQLDFFRYDPNTNAIVQDHSHPLDGLTSAPMQWFSVKPPYLISVIRPRHRDNDPEFVKVIRDWLARIGLVRDNLSTATFCIADWTTGQPLRRITGFPEQGEYRTAPDWHSIVDTTRGPNDQPGLCLYRIPHYLWEPTLSWMQWLSWLLVIPWPLRYFVQPHLAGGSIKTSPTP